MSEYKFSCPHCDQHILVPEGYAGVQINCPACLKLIVVPETPGAPKPPAPPAGLGIQRTAAQSSAAAPATRTAYNPAPAQKTGSGAMKTVLIISAVIIALAVLGWGGWIGYSKLKAKHEAAVAAKGNPAAEVPTPSATQNAGAMDILTKVH